MHTVLAASVLFAPVIPALNDSDMESVLQQAAEEQTCSRHQRPVMKGPGKRICLVSYRALSRALSRARESAAEAAPAEFALQLRELLVEIVAT